MTASPATVARPAPTASPPPHQLQPQAQLQHPVHQPCPIPNLGNVITTDDVSQKGTGKYVAEYVNWCRVTQLLREHAPGWQFHLRPAPDGSHVWVAPNGTGYLVGYFSDPSGFPTADFPQSVMDQRNAAVAVERISARDLTDTHRRALCTAAAATFGLAWQLWAKEPIEDPYREPEPQVRSIPAGPSPDDIAALSAAAAAIQASSLTADGLSALLLQFGNGYVADSISDLHPSAVAVIPKLLAVPEKVAALNRGQHTATGEQLLQLPADDDQPLAWS
jgi:hypothetical protein